MKLEDQVVNLELAKKLKELLYPNTKADSLFYWNYNSAFPEQGWYLDDENLAYPDKDTLTAFTATELLEILPSQIKTNEPEFNGYEECRTYDLEIFKLVDNNGYKIRYEWYYYEPMGDLTDDISDINLCNALAKMLIYLKENKLI